MSAHESLQTISGFFLALRSHASIDRQWLGDQELAIWLAFEEMLPGPSSGSNPNG